MKTLLFSLSIICFTFSSCQKNKDIKTNIPIDNSCILTAKYFYNEKSISNFSEIENVNSRTSFVLGTDKIDGTLSYYYFANEEFAINFMKKYSAFAAIIQNLDQVKDLRNFAIQIGEFEQYKETGKLSNTYIKYTQKYEYKARGLQGVLYTGINFTGPNFFKATTSHFPTLAAGFNNNFESSIRPIPSAAYILYDSILYTGAAFVAFPPTIPNLTFFNNRTSSIF